MNQSDKIKLRTNLLMTVKVLEDVIEDGGQFYLGHWVAAGGRRHAGHRYSMIHCGTTACIGGWLCSSKEWIESGGESCRTGLPVIPGFEPGESSLIEWYGVGESPEWRSLLSGLFGLSTGPSFRYLYNNKDFGSITIQDSIDAIQKLINKIGK